MADNKVDELNAEIMRFKSLAYDILANMEFLKNDYNNKMVELQKQLENANKQIATKDQEAKILLQEQKTQKPE